ncbi:CBS domain-containing protein [Amphritea balenae]|uniref:CBS domain-containing protein n=1 Tax=Amphritea balenae TaxID=452629 RepID=A0A3P1SLT0_9GAMM|nr:CBS domain-containing protein [Amphritea balenae]RRC98213.1 CBS domain-containing protein [Amphritea balenae]GGK80159.1 CBS domain-containing protein [Amphritea balenae]
MSDRKVVRAKDVMAQDYAMVDGLTTIKDAIDIFKQKNVSVLLINKRNNDDEYGILLLSDIAKKVLAQDRAPERVNIYEIMTKPVIGVDPQMDVRYCARLFDNFGLATAPVLDNGEVLGVVGYNQIVLDGLLTE